MERESNGGSLSELLLHCERQDPQRTSSYLPARSQKILQLPGIFGKESESLSSCTPILEQLLVV